MTYENRNMNTLEKVNDLEKNSGADSFNFSYIRYFRA